MIYISARGKTQNMLENKIWFESDHTIMIWVRGNNDLNQGDEILTWFVWFKSWFGKCDSN